jgi:hypothetical protein
MLLVSPVVPVSLAVNECCEECDPTKTGSDVESDEVTLSHSNSSQRRMRREPTCIRQRFMDSPIAGIQHSELFRQRPLAGEASLCGRCIPLLC